MSGVYPDKEGPVAQLVMRRIRIAEITGSTPVRSTKDFIWMLLLPQPTG